MMEIQTIVAGYLIEEEIKVVDMHRNTFLSIVEKVIEDNHRLYGVISDRIMSVARTMERFPFSAWIDPYRGCGCVVGEYIIVAGADRAQIASDMRSDVSTVDRMLRETEYGDSLRSFGVAIDERLKRNIAGDLPDTDDGCPVLFDDVDQYVDAIRIVDEPSES